MNTWIKLILLLGIFLASTWFLFQPGLFRVHDYTHAARIAEMARGLQDGQFPVRWSENFGYGYGMPLFVFYAPLPYLVGALIWMLGFGTEIAVKSLFLIPTLLTVVVSYSLARRWLPAYGAVLAVAAITLAPYRAVNLYVRGALAESWGMAFFIVAMLGMTYTIDSKKWGWLVLLVGLVGMVLSHNLTLVMSVPLLAGFTLVLFLESILKSKLAFKKWLHACKSILLKLVAVGVLSIGLSAFYWLPAISDKSATQLDSFILAEYFSYHLHYVEWQQFFQPNWKYGGSSWGPHDDMSFFLGLGQILGLVISGLSGCVVIFQLYRKRALSWNQPVLIYWLVGASLATLGIIALFMINGRSHLIWLSIDFLKYLQFPWRFLAVATPFLGLASVWWVLFHRKKKWFWVLWVTLLLIFIGNAVYFQPEKLQDRSKDLYATDPDDIRGWVSDVLTDYVPIGFSKVSLSSQHLRVPFSAHCEPECTVLQFSTDSNSSSYMIEATQETSLVLAQSNFPGWVAQVNGNIVPIRTGSNAQMTIPISAGTSTITVNYEGSLTMKRGDVISMISLALLLVGILLTSVGLHLRHPGSLSKQK